MCHCEVERKMSTTVDWPFSSFSRTKPACLEWLFSSSPCYSTCNQLLRPKSIFREEVFPSDYCFLCLVITWCSLWWHLWRGPIRQNHERRFWNENIRVTVVLRKSWARKSVVSLQVCLFFHNVSTFHGSRCYSSLGTSGFLASNQAAFSILLFLSIPSGTWVDWKVNGSLCLHSRSCQMLRLRTKLLGSFQTCVFRDVSKALGSPRSLFQISSTRFQLHVLDLIHSYLLKLKPALNYSWTSVISNFQSIFKTSE